MLRPCMNTEPALSDEVLAARASEGSRSAFSSLVVRYQDRVYRLAVRMSQSECDAEEVAQETLFLAHRGIGSFQGESRFSTWLYRIAINQVLMRRRAASRRPVALLGPRANDEESRLERDSEASESVDELIDRKTLTHRVREALGRLDESHRTALVLCDLEELSSEQAAEVLGITPDAVRQRAHRARLKLRDRLRGETLGAVSA